MATARRPSMSGRNAALRPVVRGVSGWSARETPGGAAVDAPGIRSVRSRGGAASVRATQAGDEGVADLVGDQAGDVAAPAGDLLDQRAGHVLQGRVARQEHRLDPVRCRFIRAIGHS